MLNLITINSDYSISINNIEVALNKNIAPVLQRRRVCLTDPTGEMKHLNTKEMAFVVLYCEQFVLDNTFAVVEDTERLDELRRDLGLPNEWYPDKVVGAACKEYLRIQAERNPSLSILTALQQGLLSSSKAIKSINSLINQVSDEIEKYKKQADLGTMTAEDYTTYAMLSTQLVTAIGQIMAIGTKIPKTLIEVSNLVAQVRKEQGSAKTAKGGYSINPREIPR